MGKKKYGDSNKNISEFIFSDYIDGMELSETNKVVKDLPLLIDNDLAYRITGSEDTMYAFTNTYRVACKFIQKYNPRFKKHRRTLRDYEFGGADSIYARNDSRLVDLAKCSLDEGTYMAQLDKLSYMVLISGFNKEDIYMIDYQIYFIGEKWRKWKKKFYKMVDEYNKIKEDMKQERILYTDGRDAITAIFKPFDQVIFSNKENVLKYIDNWVNNIPIYFDDYKMVAKLSIMLYGQPGTGKSTFARAVANYLGISNVTSVSPDYFSHHDDGFGNGGRRGGGMRTYSGLETVYSLDDIDCVCESRETNKSKENNESMAALLSFLDNPPTFQFKAKNGVRYPVSIVIASTNYYDRLDNAIKRYGRFDLNIEMKYFNKEEAQLMCDIYKLRLEDLVEDSDKKDFTISPSKLQALCLENIDKSMKEVK